MFADIVLHLEGGNCAVMNALVASILLKMAIAFRVIAPIIGTFSMECFSFFRYLLKKKEYCIKYMLISNNENFHKRSHKSLKILHIICKEIRNDCYE